jgi:hypothetical protein
MHTVSRSSPSNLVQEPVGSVASVAQALQAIQKLPSCEVAMARITGCNDSKAKTKAVRAVAGMLAECRMKLQRCRQSQSGVELFRAFQPKAELAKIANLTNAVRTSALARACGWLAREVDACKLAIYEAFPKNELTSLGTLAGWDTEGIRFLRRSAGHFEKSADREAARQEAARLAFYLMSFALARSQSLETPFVPARGLGAL